MPALTYSRYVWLVVVVLGLLPASSDACIGAMNVLECAKFFHCNTFVQYAKKTGVQNMSQAKDMTLFLPVDNAFKSLPKDILSNDAIMKEIILYHMLPQRIEFSSLKNEQVVTSSSTDGRIVRINVYESPKSNSTIKTATGAVVLLGDETASNGNINLINKVMYPRPSGSLYEYLVKTPEYSTLLLLVTRAGLLDTLKGGIFSLFAPGNGAFSKLPAGVLAELLSDIPKLIGVLEGHLVNRTVYTAGLQTLESVTTISGVQIHSSRTNLDNGKSKAAIIMPDVSATNGVLHEIDTVLT